jgi:hypothetical protein
VSVPAFVRDALVADKLGSREGARKGRAAYPRCRRLPSDMALVRSSDRGERDRAAGMALTIQIVAKRSPEVAPASTPTSPKQSPSRNRGRDRSDRHVRRLLVPRCSHADFRLRLVGSRLKRRRRRGYWSTRRAAVSVRPPPGRLRRSGAGCPDSDRRGLIGGDCECGLRGRRGRRLTRPCLGTDRASASRSTLLRFVEGDTRRRCRWRFRSRRFVSRRPASS